MNYLSERKGWLVGRMEEAYRESYYHLLVLRICWVKYSDYTTDYEIPPLRICWIK